PPRPFSPSALQAEKPTVGATAGEPFGRRSIVLEPPRPFVLPSAPAQPASEARPGDPGPGPDSVPPVATPPPATTEPPSAMSSPSAHSTVTTLQAETDAVLSGASPHDLKSEKPESPPQPAGAPIPASILAQAASSPTQSVSAGDDAEQ